MTDIRTPSEAKARVVDAMGHELGTLYHEIHTELIVLHSKWTEYVTLFGTSEQRIDFLNSTVPSFAWLIQETLWNDIILHIARLTDPKVTKVGGKEKPNLTIQRLPDSIPDTALKDSIEEKVQAAIKITAFCKDRRNRHIAHTDLDLALSTGNAVPLIDSSRIQIRNSLEALASILNSISHHYLDSEMAFSAVSVSRGGALSLLYLLDDGHYYQQEQKALRKNGTYDRRKIRPVNF